MKAANKGGYKSYKLMSNASKPGAEGPKKSVKGPVRGGPATGRGVAANKKPKRGR